MTHARALRQDRPAHSVGKRFALAAAAAAICGTAILGAAQPAAAAPAASTSELRTAVVNATNEARAAKGCTAALKVSTRLTKSAQGHADDMAAKEYFSHTSKDGRSWDTRIRNAGWTKPGGENIAYGYEAAKSVMKAWMDSPGHKRNILNCKFNYIGIGYTADGHYWVQNFGY